MFRRLLSVLLAGIFMMGAASPALGESGITAGEALFGNGTGAAMNDAPDETPSPEATAETAEDDDVYGENDQASIMDYPTLQLGDRDEADSAAYIVMLQNRLIALGFLNDAADGVYGENTETAVAQFQKLNGLERTGVADPETQRLLFSDLSTLTTPSPEDPVVYGSEAIRVQTKMVEWGFMVGSVDGVLGKASTKAITDFKKYLIDNGMAYTDFTIGFDTALNTACDCLNKIRETSDSHERASMLTVMGRNCGDIALHTALTCGAEICMIPEIPWDIVEVAERVKWGVLRGKRSMIIVFAEGALSSLTTDLEKLCAEHEELHDIVPHHNMITSSQIAMIIETLSGHETRSTVLGYIQRGGSPSARDRLLATQLGAHAAELLAADRGGLAVGIRGTRLIEVPFSDVQKGDHAADTGLNDLVNVMAVIN